MSVGQRSSRVHMASKHRPCGVCRLSVGQRSSRVHVVAVRACTSSRGARAPCRVCTCISWRVHVHLALFTSALYTTAEALIPRPKPCGCTLHPTRKPYGCTRTGALYNSAEALISRPLHGRTLQLHRGLYLYLPPSTTPPMPPSTLTTQP